MEEIVRLRGHHILCLLGFRGLGYSEEFVENMARVQARVFSADCRVEIVAGADDICRACPRLVDGRCNAENHSRADDKDAAVLELLSLRPGERPDAAAIYRRVAEAVTPEERTHICSECRWEPLGYCADGLIRLLQDQGWLTSVDE